MSDLLSIGRSGVLAYQGAMKTIGENVTNANSDGYSRRTVVLKEQSSYQGPYTLNRSGSAFNGVQSGAVQRVWDQYQASNAWTANSDASSAGTRAQYMSTIESGLNDTDSGVGTRLTAVFAAVTKLAANPADPSLRQNYLAALSDAATAFNATASNLTTISGTIQTQAGVQVNQANSAMAALGQINIALRTTPQGSTSRAQLEDQRDSLLSTLSGTFAINTSFASDGSVTVRLNDNMGPLLVSGASAAPSTVKLQTADDGRLSMSVTSADGADVTAATPTGGSMAGLVDAANTNAGRRQQLDALAVQLGTLVNDNQAGGLNDAGTAGIPLMSGTDAASLTLASNDITAIAAKSADGTANGNLTALLASRDGTGVEAKWKGMVNDQALQVSSAKLASTAATARKDNADSALDQTTGVDLDNEAADLLRFQQAYSASAKIISAARETFQAVLDLL